jgi:hypothetical protein
MARQCELIHIFPHHHLRPTFLPNEQSTSKHKIYLREAMTAFFSTFPHTAILQYYRPTKKHFLCTGPYGDEIQTVQLW